MASLLSFEKLSGLEFDVSSVANCVIDLVFLVVKSVNLLEIILYPNYVISTMSVLLQLCNNTMAELE